MNKPSESLESSATEGADDVTSSRDLESPEIPDAQEIQPDQQELQQEPTKFPENFDASLQKDFGEISDGMIRCTK